MDDLPDLPFEQVLSYLRLEDRLKARTVSRGWRKKFDSYPVKSLCYAGRPLGFIEIKRRLVSGAFVSNFIFSTKFDSFFNAFSSTILSNLKRLRFYDLGLEELNAVAFASTLNSFGQLEELGLFEIYGNGFDQIIELELNLPMLTSLQLERVLEIEELTLNAPRLQMVRVERCSNLSLVIVHGESVECLLTDWFGYTEVKKLKNLQQIHSGTRSAISSTLLYDLDQLKEFHTMERDQVADLFEQKQRYGRMDLKIYYWGFLLNSPDDQLTGNLSSLTAWMPLYNNFNYSETERCANFVQTLGRLTDLNRCAIDDPVQDIERFLCFLKKFQNIVELFFGSAQPQDLFDQLPDHSAIQKLTILRAPSDLEFLFRLKHLNFLNVRCSLDAKQIRKIHDELPFLSHFEFDFNKMSATIEVTRDSGWTHPERYRVWYGTYAEVPDLEAAIQLLVQSA